MHTCPLVRYTCAARPTRAARWRQYWHVADIIATTLATWLGWRAFSDLLDLLEALPDSNDDFGLF